MRAMRFIFTKFEDNLNRHFWLQLYLIPTEENMDFIFNIHYGLVAAALTSKFLNLKKGVVPLKTS